MRPEEDADYRKDADKAKEEDKEFARVAEHNRRVEAEAEDIIRKKVKSRVHLAQDKIAEDRSIVNRWKNIKFQ